MSGDGHAGDLDHMPPSCFFDEQLRQDANSAFGADGAWLILSIVWYGWRSYFDLAAATVGGPKPAAGRRPADYDEDFQVVLDLSVQSFVFSATEQLATLVGAARTHLRDGTFFEEYCRNVAVGERVRDIQDMTSDELAELAGLPTSISDVPDFGEQPDVLKGARTCSRWGSGSAPRCACRLSTEWYRARKSDIASGSFECASTGTYRMSAAAAHGASPGAE